MIETVDIEILQNVINNSEENELKKRIQIRLDNNNRKNKTINAKEVVDYDLAKGGFYTITFVSENNSYFSLCRDFDEEDEKIYFEIDEQCNALYAFPEEVTYNLDNGVIEFSFKDIELETYFEKHIIINFPTVSEEQFNAIKKTLENIWKK